MSERILASKKSVKGMISSSKNCSPCNLTQGVCIKGANSFVTFNFNETDINKAVLMFHIKKISGNGIFYTNIDNFLQKHIAHSSFILEVPYSKSVTISKQSDSIGDISIHKITLSGDRKKEEINTVLNIEEKNLAPPIPITFVPSICNNDFDEKLFLAQKNAIAQAIKHPRSTLRDGTSINKKLYTNTKDYAFDVVKTLTTPYKINIVENTNYILYFGKSVWNTAHYSMFNTMLETYDLSWFGFNILECLPVKQDIFNYLLEKAVAIICDFHSLRTLKEYIKSDKIEFYTSETEIYNKIINTDVGYINALDKILMLNKKAKSFTFNEYEEGMAEIIKYKEPEMKEVVVEESLTPQEPVIAPVLVEVAEPKLDIKFDRRDGVRFKIIVPAYNSERWIKKTLNSISIQKYKNYDVCIVDDKSTDPNQRNIIKAHCEAANNEFNTWKFIFNKVRLGALCNIEMAINNSDCDDEDVCVTVDGDDWLYDENTLNLVNNAYKSGDILMTYGQYISYPSMTKGHCRHYHPRIIRGRDYRKADWLMSHLRTFKYKLFKNIKHQDLLDPRTGKHYAMAWDLALMYPMSEISGDRIKFIENYTYIYNLENPINDHKVNVGLQASSNGIIRRQKKYDYIKF